MELYHQIEEHPFLYNDDEISLDLLVRLTNTHSTFYTAKRLHLLVTKAFRANAKHIKSKYKLKKIVLLPVNTLTEVIEWEMDDLHVSNVIPAYQKVFDPRLPSEFFTSWYFAQRYLVRCSRYSKQDIQSLSVAIRGEGVLYADVTEWFSYDPMEDW